MSLYSPTLPRAKPPRWAPVSKGLIAPEWQWVWNGMIGAWLLNEGGGTIVQGIGGARISGTLTNIASPPTATSGWNPGSTLYFDGSNDFVDLGSHSSLKPTTGHSVTALVKRTGALATFTGIYKSPQNGTQGGFMMVGVATTNKIRFYLDRTGNSAWSYAESNLALPLNEYHVLTGTWDGATVRLYVDGVLQTATAAATTIGYNTTTVNATIGEYSTKYWLGAIDAVLVHSWALPPRGVVQLAGDVYGAFRMARRRVYRAPSVGAPTFVPRVIVI